MIGRLIWFTWDYLSTPPRLLAFKLVISVSSFFLLGEFQEILKFSNLWWFIFVRLGRTEQYGTICSWTSLSLPHHYMPNYQVSLDLNRRKTHICGLTQLQSHGYTLKEEIFELKCGYVLDLILCTLLIIPKAKDNSKRTMNTVHVTWDWKSWLIIISRWIV